MGLFSKKEYVCEKCGTTFTKRLNLNGNVCDACAKAESEERSKLRDAVGGYESYHFDMTLENYTVEELHEIAEHKKAIVEKYKNNDWITKAKLGDAGENYKKLTEEQVDEIIRKIGATSLESTLGAAYASGFYVPSKYDGVIVDAEDIFAVCFATDMKTNIEGRNEGVLCAMFTNDPYIPVFSIEFAGKKGLFDIVKSKKGRDAAATRFERECPNLTYPVCDVKQLKKLINGEEEVNGDLSKEFVLKQLDKLSSNSGIFNMKKVTEELSLKSLQMVEKMGYIRSEEINALLKMDKMFNRKFWEKQIARYNMSE